MNAAEVRNELITIALLDPLEQDPALKRLKVSSGVTMGVLRDQLKKIMCEAADVVAALVVDLINEVWFMLDTDGGVSFCRRTTLRQQLRDSITFNPCHTRGTPQHCLPRNEALSKISLCR